MQDLALRAAEAFYCEKEKRFGVRSPKPQNAYQNDRSWNTGFYKTGMLCYDHDWDPWDYVRFVFNLVNDQGQFLLGRDLIDTRMISSYEKATKEQLDEYGPEDDWRFNEQELYKRAGKDDRLACSYLMSPLYGFPAWFRYVKGNSEVKKAWKATAEREVRQRTDLREWLVDRFPKTMKGLLK